MAEQRAQVDAGSFAAKLRRYRSAANLTQEELAARAGLSVHAIGMLERGVRKAPRPRTVALLAVALELEPAERHALVAAARDRTPDAGSASPDQPESEDAEAAAVRDAAAALPHKAPRVPAPNRRTIVAWLGLAAFVVVVAFTAQMASRGSATARIAVAVAAALAIFSAAFLTNWLTRTNHGARGSTSDQLDRAADDLAEQVRLQWTQAAVERGLLYPVPIRVRWRLSHLRVAGPIADAAGEDAELPRFAPLPGIPKVTAPAATAGDLRSLFAVYGGLDSGRLVILGEPGAGKTGVAIRLLLAALEHRRSLTDGERSGVPVPVLINVRGWDPAGRPLLKWLALRVAEEHPMLRSAVHGRDIALRLLRATRLTVFLDGLDEMRPDLRTLALRALDGQATFRLVLICRSRELQDATWTAHLSDAAAVELQPVDSREAVAYLERCTPQPAPAAWQRVLDNVRCDPASPVTKAMDTPLALSLVRDTYGPGSPVDELLDRHRFGSADQVIDHLLDRVLPAAYLPQPGRAVPRYTLAQAQRWFGFLAWRMSQESAGGDLAWWLVPRWQPAWRRNLITVATVAVVSSLAGAAIDAAHAVAVGAPVTLATLALLHTGGPPRQVGWPKWGRILSRPNITLGIAVALAGSLVFGVSVSLAAGIGLGLVVGPLVGVILGLAANLSLGLADGLGSRTTDPVSPIDPIISWRRDSQYVLAVMVASTAIAGITAGLAEQLTSWLYTGLTWGLTGGLVGGLAIGLVVALSRALEGRFATGLVGRLAQSLTRTIAFGLALGLAAGSAAGLVANLEEGLLVGLDLGLGFGLAFVLSDSAAWSALLTFAQLRRLDLAPLRLLRFLEDARRRQVLRVAGPVYQFRHARLQERLALAFSDEDRRRR